MSAETTAQYAPGEMLDDKYRVDALLSEGGMGTVYAGTHTLLRKRVAIKILKAELAANASMVERFRREAVAASAIGHPNIVTVTDVGSTKSGVAFLVMELLEGRSLARVIKDDGPLPVGRACAIACEILEGIAAAHERGIVHRDIKPDNVFLVDHGARGESVKLLDFGIATFAPSALPSPRLTGTGTIVGTPSFMAPEQARGDKEVGLTVDVYSIAVVLYEMLTARLPYDGGNYNLLIHQILSGAIVKLSARRADLPAELEAVIARAMALAPEDRFPSAADMAAALAPFCATAPDAPSLVATGERTLTGERPRIRARSAPPIDPAAKTMPAGTLVPVMVKTADPTPPVVAPVRRAGSHVALAAVAVAGVSSGLLWWHSQTSTAEKTTAPAPTPAKPPAPTPAKPSAPKAILDLACAGAAPSSHAVDPLRITGAVDDLIASTAVGGVHVSLLRRGHVDDAPLGSADSSADGSFAFTVATGGAPIDAIVRYVHEGYRTTWVDPGDPMTNDLSKLHLLFHPLYTSADLDELARAFGVAPRDPTRAIAIVIVHDCAEHSLAGATVSFDPPGPVLYISDRLLPARDAMATSTTGLAIAFERPAGRAIVRASLAGRAFAPHPVELHAGDVTIVVVHP